MYLLTYPNRVWEWLRSSPRSPRFDPVQLLVKLLDTWDALDRLSDKIHYHGMYEILDYDATLEIKDPKGQNAVLTRGEVIRSLQDNA